MAAEPQLTIAPLTVVVGPTASGKTTTAISIAREGGGEIIGADSQQVYRHFNLGLAKPTAAQLAQVPHHLISFVEPDEEFSAATWVRQADALVAELQSRGEPVVVVGGSGMYLRMLLYGVVATTPRDTALRQAMTEFAETRGDVELHARLAAVDPESARALHVHDRVRVIRALEISLRQAQPASALRQAHGFRTAKYAYRAVVMDPPRAELYAAIDARAHAMFQAGLVDEVRALVARGYREAAPMRALGYQQALAVVDGKLSESEAVERTAQATRRYAKRQLTWLRNTFAAMQRGANVRE